MKHRRYKLETLALLAAEAASWTRRMLAVTHIIDEEHALACLPKTDCRRAMLEINKISFLLGMHEMDLPYNSVKSPSDICNMKLMRHQVEALLWMVNLHALNRNGILADDMGLGKTIMSLSFVAWLLEYMMISGPHLFIVPLGTFVGWIDALTINFPTIKWCLYYGPQEHRDRLITDIARKVYTVVVTSPEVLGKDQELQKLPFHLLVVDEGHRVKNPRSLFHLAVLHIKAKMKILLTGTPIQNEIKELWSLLRILYPRVFHCESVFEDVFGKPFRLETQEIKREKEQLKKTQAKSEEEQQQKFERKQRSLDKSTEEMNADHAQPVHSSEANELKDAANGSDSSSGSKPCTNDMKASAMVLAGLHAVIRPFFLRRTKANVFTANEIPKKYEYTIRVPFSPAQGYFYRQVESGIRHVLANKRDSGCQIAAGEHLKLISRLRQIAQHACLTGERCMPNGDGLITGSGKMELLDRMIPKLVAANHKVLIFSQYVKVLRMIEMYFLQVGYVKNKHFVYLSGSMNLEDRCASMRMFTHSSECQIFLLSTRAGGVGLNLQAANYIILFDPDWNPQMDFQAICRAYRIGQKRQVHVFRLYGPVRSVEQYMVLKSNAKLDMTRKAVDLGEFSNRVTSLALDQLTHDIINYDQTLTPAENFTLPTKLNEYLSQSQEEMDAFNLLDDESLHEGWKERCTNSADFVDHLIALGRFVDETKLVKCASGHETRDLFKAREDIRTYVEGSIDFEDEEEIVLPKTDQEINAEREGRLILCPPQKMVSPTRHEGGEYSQPVEIAAATSYERGECSQPVEIAAATSYERGECSQPVDFASQSLDNHAVP